MAKKKRDSGSSAANEHLSEKAMVQVRAAIWRAYPRYISQDYADLARALRGMPQPPDFCKTMEESFSSQLGIDLKAKYSYNFFDGEDLLGNMSDVELLHACRFNSQILHILDGRPVEGWAWIHGPQFDTAINSILESEQFDIRLQNGALKEAVASAVDALYKVLLSAEGDEMAGCTQGDVQVEMVASTIQSHLSKQGSILVDYGAGMGRVLDGVRASSHFNNAKYIAVEETINSDVVKTAKSAGATLVSRQDFLSENTEADVIMVVNTLHHIPFSDIPKQLGNLLQKLRPNGLLVIHEMGELRKPEQKNVPWTVVDIQDLFASDLFTVNARATKSKRGVPLANALVSMAKAGDVEAALKKNAAKVWGKMKERTLQEITMYYDGRDEGQVLALQYSVITNANLDLNKP